MNTTQPQLSEKHGLHAGLAALALALGILLASPVHAALPRQADSTANQLTRLLDRSEREIRIGGWHGVPVARAIFAFERLDGARGGFADEALARQLRHALQIGLAGVEHCVADLRVDASGTQVHGTMRILVSLNAAGTVESQQWLANDVREPKLQECVASHLARIRLARAPGSPVVVEIPLRFGLRG